MPTLFDPLKVGDLTLKNRIVMAPLTRARSGVERTPGPMVAQYYAQRASAGLIISEATSVTPLGVGYADTPGIWSEAQVEGWKLTTKAVHDAGGLIFMQLWHVGRISDPSLLDGQAPVSASAIAVKGDVSLLRPKRPYPTPRALTLAEIAEVVEAYRQGAENAKRAGFEHRALESCLKGPPLEGKRRSNRKMALRSFGAKGKCCGKKKVRALRKKDVSLKGKCGVN